MAAEEPTRYDPARVSAFYDAYGEEEWHRLEATPRGRLMLALHLRLLDRHAAPGQRALDAGCGPGRFAIELARRGARVTLLDLSPGQLAIAREKVAAAGVGAVEAYLQADVSDLSLLPDDGFDLTVCLGGALNYPLGREARAVSELVRVTRPGGKLLIGVMSLWGAVRHALAGTGAPFVAEAERYRLWETLETGTIPPLDFIRQPPRHLFTARELRGLLESADCRVLEMASTPSAAAGLNQRIEEISADPVAWANLVEVEARAASVDGLLDVGEHLLAVAEAL